jgi:3-hydroxyisobutyrate dehydrogenase
VRLHLTRVRGGQQLELIGSVLVMHPTKVYVVGLGRMGLPIATNIRRGGFAVTGVDPRPEAEGWAGHADLRWRRTLVEGAAEADVVVSMLPSSDLTLEEGRAGLPLMRPGSSWIDMGSNGPQVAAAMAALADGTGVRLLEAPVGGGPAEAEHGRLQLYVGGDCDVLDASRDVLTLLADPGGIHYIGPAGHGYLAKLLANLLWFSQAVSTTEALLLAARAGLDLDRLHDAWRSSAIGGRFVDRDVTALLAGDYRMTFGLRGCVDELDLVEDLATESRSPFELSAVVARTYRDALTAFGEVDGELLVAKLLENRAGDVLHHHRRA